MLWRVWVAVGALVTCSYLLIPDGIPRDLVYVGVGVASIVGTYVGVRRNRPPSAAAWYLFAAGMLSWVVADSIYSWNLDVRDVEPFPSAADVFYLGAYPLLAAGIAVLIRQRGERVDLGRVIDSAIVVASLGLLSWTWIARPMIEASDVPVLERTISVAYPVADIILMALLVRLMSGPSAASAPHRLLVAAVALQVVADTALAAEPSSPWDYSSVLDLLWLGSYVLWTAAALHPQMADLSRRSLPTHAPFTRRRMAALSAAALLPSTTFLVALATGRSVDPWAVTVGTFVLTSLVLVRTSRAITEIRMTTGQRDRLQEELFHHAAHDPLTGLFNRAYMLSLIDGALRRGRMTGAATGLVVIDLDRLAAVNDDRGPQAGDTVLREASRRIRSVTNVHGVVGRLGDRQFVVLVEAPDAETRTTDLAERLVTALRRPYVHHDQTLSITPRIGLSMSSDAATDPGALLQGALIANRRAKASGTTTFEVFDHRLRMEHTRQTQLEESLRRAIADNALELHYQPVVAVTTGAVLGYEALIRWNGPDGLRMPGDLIPVAERSDLICDIGRWVLVEATRQLAEWLATDPARFEGLTVAVNISGRHLADRRIVEDVRAALRTSGLPARHLVIEVTETALVDVPQAVTQLSALREIGTSVSLDDFGTGYTSVGQLRDLPIDTVKIDKSFFDSVEPGASELVALMTGAAHAGGMRVVAEGIERTDQLALPKRLSCDAAQGYLFSHPLPAAAVLAGDAAPSRRHG